MESDKRVELIRRTIYSVQCYRQCKVIITVLVIYWQTSQKNINMIKSDIAYLLHSKKFSKNISKWSRAESLDDICYESEQANKEGLSFFELRQFNVFKSETPNDYKCTSFQWHFHWIHKTMVLMLLPQWEW